MSKKVWLPIALAGAIVLVLIVLVWLLFARVERTLNPDPVSIASASLDGLREQNRLTVFSASYNATVTTSLTRLGLSARKTLIMPGQVRYEVDLAKLNQDDVRWDPESGTLSVRLPAIEIARPEVQIDQIQTYDDGGILIALTDADRVLDQANRKKGVAELAKQAKNPLQIRFARDAARNAVANSFALPLQAAGLDAKVDVFFPYERGANKDQWDLSRPIQDVLAEKKQLEDVE
ncbi:MAG: hypothetical protein Pars2KO_03490 [Parasphingorhabdus sp.]